MVAGAEAAGGVGVVGAWVELSLGAAADEEEAAVAAWLLELRLAWRPSVSVTLEEEVLTMQR